MSKNNIILFVCSLIFLSCTNEPIDPNILLDEPSVNINNPNCPTPNGFTITTSNASSVILGWNSESDNQLWEVEYGQENFIQGTGILMQSNTNSLLITNLESDIVYEFYLRRVCESGNSAWTLPITNNIQNLTESQALMTANLDGVQYDYMVPYLYNVFNINAVRVVNFSGTDENFIHIQGNTTPDDVVLSNSREINIHIPESQWSEGTYTLEIWPTDSSGQAVSKINMIHLNISSGFTQVHDEEGTVTITEFNLTEKRIRGTFEFTYYISNPSTDEEIGPLQCLNGTFNYSLDDDFFN